MFIVTKRIKSATTLLSMCCTTFFVIFTLRSLYHLSKQDNQHIKNHEKAANLMHLSYSPLDGAVKASGFRTRLEYQNLQREKSRIDFKYCGGPCRFINVLYIREQETRAQLHLRHLAFTAGLVNRTIVLPNVSGSHLGACLPYAFDYYYDMAWAESHKEYFKYITIKRFKSWIQERKLYNVPVSDQVMSTFDTEVLSQPISPNCFEGYTQPVSSFNQVLSWDIVGQTDPNAVSARGEIMINFLKGSPEPVKGAYANDDIEILHMEIHKANQWSSIPEADVPIPYSPELIQLADKNAKSLAPYIAIHWRMEASINPDNMLPCAQHLISRLQKNNMKKYKIFLLTDYPHLFNLKQHNYAVEGRASQEQLKKWLQSNSDSFLMEDFTSSHHKAVQYLYKHAKFHLMETAIDKNLTATPSNWKLIPIPNRFKKLDILHSDKSIKMIDSGWLGILDKLMAIRSYHFFAVRKGDVCGRSKSTFTAQIISERQWSGRPKVSYFGQSSNSQLES